MMRVQIPAKMKESIRREHYEGIRWHAQKDRTQSKTQSYSSKNRNPAYLDFKMRICKACANSRAETAWSTTDNGNIKILRHASLNTQ